MDVYKLYVSTYVVGEHPPTSLPYTKRRIYFTDARRSEWRVDIYVERGINLTSRKLDQVIPQVVWWITNDLCIRASDIMYVDPKPLTKKQRERFNSTSDGQPILF